MAKYKVRTGYVFKGKMSDPLEAGAIIDDQVEKIEGQEHKLELVQPEPVQPASETEGAAADAPKEEAQQVGATDEAANDAPTEEVDNGGRETAGNPGSAGSDADAGTGEATTTGGREA